MFLSRQVLEACFDYLHSRKGRNAKNITTSHTSSSNERGSSADTPQSTNSPYPAQLLLSEKTTTQRRQPTSGSINLEKKEEKNKKKRPPHLVIFLSTQSEPITTFWCSPLTIHHRIYIKVRSSYSVSRNCIEPSSQFYTSNPCRTTRVSRNRAIITKTTLYFDF